MTLKLSADDDICTKELILKKLLVATYLDPRCKSLPFLSDAEKNFVVENFEDLEGYLSAQSVHEELESSNNNPVETDKDLSEVSELSAPSKNYKTFR